MTLPETCGEAGGAISLWLRVIGCDDAGIVSTVAWLHDYASGSVLDCYGNVLRYAVSQLFRKHILGTISIFC